MKFYKRLFKFAWFLFLSVLLVSCNNIENIEIGEPHEVKIQGFEDNFLKVDVAIPVDNPSILKIKIKEIDVRVYFNGRYIGKLFVDKSIEVKGKENRIYDLPVKIRLSNILTTAFIMMNLKQGQRVEVRFEGTITAKTMFLTRKIDINETRKIVI